MRRANESGHPQGKIIWEPKNSTPGQFPQRQAFPQRRLLRPSIELAEAAK
jgi:hypothetical protein